MQCFSYDIVIVGGGIVGCTLACALAQKTNLSIAVLERSGSSEVRHHAHYDHRVSAITLSSQRIFKSLQIWDTLEAMRVSPFVKILVWDAFSKSEIDFNSQSIDEPILGFIIENSVIQKVLTEKIKTYSRINVIAPIQLKAFETCDDHIQLITEDEQVFQAKVAVAADGAHSWLREKAEIRLSRQDYAQTAIVATVKTDLPHQKIARQVFVNNGTLAFLPLLDDHTSSIVFAQSTDVAKQLLSLDDHSFNKALTTAFSHRLGEVTLLSECFSFPLYQQQAENYIKPSLVLVGDAAHTAHPLAGQGLNIGLLDAASLAEVMIDAYNKKQDIANLHSLRRYERWRKADNFTMLTGIDLIQKLFSRHHKPLPKIRSLGLQVVNQVHSLKNFFIHQAVGDRAGLPKMAMKS